MYVLHFLFQAFTNLPMDAQLPPFWRGLHKKIEMFMQHMAGAMEQSTSKIL